MAEDIISMYLNDIGKHPLLTAEEERELARSIERGRESQLALAQHVGQLAVGDEAQPELVLDTEARRTHERNVQSGAEAKQRFIKSNLRLVVSIARRYPIPQGMGFLDLVQEGNLGLEHAVDKYEWRKGFKFSTYATFWVRQAIGRALDQKGSLIRVPGDKSARLRGALRATGTDGEQLPPEEALLHRLTNHASLDKSVGEDDGPPLGELIASSDLSPEERLMQNAETEMLESLLATLDERTRYIIRKRYGLDTGVQGSYREIGDEFGVTAEAIRRTVSRGESIMAKNAKDIYGISSPRG